jgi:chromosome segregation ATPase
MVYIILGLIVLVGYGVLYVIQRQTREKEHEKRRKEIDDFKNQADKVQIDLNQLSLKSNEWQEEIVTDNSKYGGYNQLVGRGDLNIETVQHSLNALELSVSYKGQTIDVLRRVNMDTKTLKMKLAIQEKTTLYINPEEPQEYYLDLEFLNSP